MNNFTNFLRDVEKRSFETNTTATGALTIQQSKRNQLRKEGVAAFKADLEDWFSKFDGIEVLETKDGLVVTVENEPGNFTFSWEIKNAIKSLDYDPFIEAGNFDDAEEEKRLKKERINKEKAEKIARIQEKRARKLEEIEAKKNQEA